MDIIPQPASKRCTKCGEQKPFSQYHRKPVAPDGHKYACKSCTLAYERTRYPTYRKRKLRSRYGITEARYEQMATAQGHRCAICGQPETGRANNGAIRRLAVDHCHKTGMVRDLLCGWCNRRLAQREAEGDWVERAEAYLQRHSRSRLESP